MIDCFPDVGNVSRKIIGEFLKILAGDVIPIGWQILLGDRQGHGDPVFSVSRHPLKGVEHIFIVNRPEGLSELGQDAVSPDR